MPDPNRPPRLAQRGIYNQRGGGLQADPKKSRGEGRLHAHDDRGQYRAIRLPGPNEACTCGSGRKWKRCHGDPAKSGAPVVNRVEAGRCDACGKDSQDTIPLRHTGIPDWSARICIACAQADLGGTFKRLLASHQASTNPVAKGTSPEGHSDPQRESASPEAPRFPIEAKEVPDG